MYLSFDGGGSKLNAMLFDDEMNLLATAKSGGVNTTQGSWQDCLHNVNTCVQTLFENGAPERIKALYHIYIGPVQMLYTALEQYTKVEKICPLSEAQGGVLAGRASTSGIVAISGTGGTIGVVDGDTSDAIGGWGPMLGDQGSGAWIGQMAARAAVEYINGWGEKTLLTELIMEDWQCSEPWDMVKKVHESSAPFRTVATLTRTVGRAVRLGDAVAIRILDEAARYMAIQTQAALERFHPEGDGRNVVLCGGAWKTHPMFPQKYRTYMHERYPDVSIASPLFEHVCAGPVSVLLQRPECTKEAIIKTLSDKMSFFRIPDLFEEPIEKA